MKRTIAVAIVLALILSLALPAAALAKRGGAPAKGNGRGHTPAIVSGEDEGTGEGGATDPVSDPVPDKGKGKGKANKSESAGDDSQEAEDGDKPKPSWETTPTGIENAYSRVLRNLERRYDRGKFLPPGLVSVLAKFAGWLGIEVPPIGEEAELAWLQEHTSISGTLDALVATFPDSIPEGIVEEPYKINSRMTLADPLPAGTTVEITRDGGTPIVVSGDLIPAGTPFWWTDLAGGTAADFDEGYAGAVETYSIKLAGPGPFESTLLIESVISKDGFVNETVLASTTVAVVIP